MPFQFKLRRAVIVAALSATIAGLGSASASAQDLFDFLWSGGSQSSVAFSPRYEPGQIIHSRGEATSYPIAVPRQKSRWSGVTHVSQKKVNPGWTPTPEMRRENPKLPAHVPGGHPLNPLGNRALYLGSSLYRIHGTDAPWTIGSAVSKGCIRMYNEDAAHLYSRVNVGTKVTVTWKKFTTY